jgi:hypothetical protein
MHDIDIKRKHDFSRDEAKKKVEGLAQGLRHEMNDGTWTWVGKYVLEGTATGLKMGRITVAAKSIHVELDLAFYLPAARVRQKVLDRLELDFPEPD